MPDTTIPELRVGIHGGVWTVAVADQHGWVEAGTGEPLDNSIVATWTALAPRAATQSAEQVISEIPQPLAPFKRAADAFSEELS